MLSAFKNFGVTFLISALLFGVAAYFTVGFVLNTVSSIIDEEKNELDQIIQHPDNEQDSQNDTDTEITSPDDELEGESFNFLVITTDFRPDLYDNYRPTLDNVNKKNWGNVSPDETAGFLLERYRKVSASSIVLCRIDKENHRYIYSYISPSIRVYTSYGYRTLAEVYEYYGKQTLAEYVNSLTGIKVKYTFLINGYNLDEIVSLLGEVSTNVSRDIYSDGMYYSMQYETTEKSVDDNDNEIIEHIPNTFVLSKGDIKATGENLYTILSLKEHSIADVKAKEAYTVDILAKYISAIGMMEKEEQQSTLAKLITKESEWVNIDGVASSDNTAQTEKTADDESSAENNDNVIPWKILLGEPEDAMIDTDYTMNEFDSITELISAVSEFETLIITYPCSYISETAETPGYFKAELEEALKRYAPYKISAQNIE